MTILRLAAVCATLVLAACSLERPLPEATTYSIEPTTAAAAPVTRRPETLRMGSVRVASAFDSRELVYRLDDVRFSTDFYNRFIAPPGPMLGTRMADWLNRSGPFRAVIQPGVAPATPFVLEAVVTDLYGDFRPNRKPEAVMTIQFYLLNTAGLAPQVVLERSIGRRVELSQPSPEVLVRGYSSALGGILTELSAEIAKSDMH